MSSLAELYASMMDAIYGDTLEASSYIAAHGELSPQAQLDIYNGSVQGGLVQALGDLFPATKGLIGDRFFDAMALRYVSLYPSRSSSLDQYGEFFPSFIAEFKPLADLPYTADLAALEWSWHCAFHAQATEPITSESLAKVPAEKVDSVQFLLVAPLFLCRSDYPLIELWHLGRSEVESAPTLDINQGGGCYVVYRDGFNVLIENLAEPLFDLLDELNKPQDFGTICEKWLSKHPGLELEAFSSELMQRSWIAGFRFNNA